ncbi:glycosyltransferase family 2 protein [Acinetobacter ursingii]|uniref:glycosyltransferase family 2 protein n=1 Tax=Acinetobacter ursingii TaxID=108980 RepID=UPI0012508062|nr:glycosyltransferase family 2 protein [Acinetobacter ursingii]
MKQVDIAMATYNGERYIEEQIRSIQQQTYTNWILYISDDGSSDRTVSLIRKMMENDTRIKLINTNRQGGVIQNFNEALSRTTANYILLCDQDDIWPKERLAVLVLKLESIEYKDPSQAILIFTDLELIDDRGNRLENSFYESNGLSPMENMINHSLLWQSTVYGCTTIMNRNLLNISLPIPEYALMHDQWLALNAAQNDSLYYHDIKSIQYRQHSGNVVGGTNHGFLGKFHNFKKNLKSIKKSVAKSKLILKNHPNLYIDRNSLNHSSLFRSFAIREILPKIFKGSKKIQAFFVFIVVIFNLS